MDPATGDIHLLYSRDNKEVFATRSTDGGLTWGPSTNITASLQFTLDVAHPFVATGPPGGLSLPSGRLVGAMYYNGVNGTRSAALFSDDHGATWARGTDVPVSQKPFPNASSVVYQGGESQVARLEQAGPGGLVMLMRVRGDFPPPPLAMPPWPSSADGVVAHAAQPNAVDHNHATAVSLDGGQSWSDASLLPIFSSFCEGSILTGAPLVPHALSVSLPSWRDADADGDGWWVTAGG